VAKLVMEHTDHIMLVGEGALRFAKAMGFAEENLLTEKARIAWLTWKQSLRDPNGHTNWGEGLDAPPHPSRLATLRGLFPHADDETLAWAWEMAVHPTTGTINCLALNTKARCRELLQPAGSRGRSPDVLVILRSSARDCMWIRMSVAPVLQGAAKKIFESPARTPSSKT
jgi:N4-(beta-N-acetylglucosaminyl)-L-asparaginase